MQEPQNLPQNSLLYHSIGLKVVLIVLSSNILINAKKKFDVLNHLLPVIQKAIGIGPEAPSLLSTPTCLG